MLVCFRSLSKTCFSPQGVDELLGGDADGEDEDDDQDDDQEEGSEAQRGVRSPSLLTLKGPSPPPDMLNTDGTLMLFASSSCSRTGYVCGADIWESRPRT